MKRLWMASGLILALTTLSAPAQERDILDAALERPLDTIINGEPVRFGDRELDEAEIWLRDYLPRPWTTTRIHSLFQAAYTRLGKTHADEFEEWMELVEQLGRVLAASRDPRAALALVRAMRVEERADRGLHLAINLSNSLVDYFGSDPSYRSPPFKETGNVACFGSCGYFLEDAHKWWQLNQREVEQRAATVIAGLPPCGTCRKEALAAIDQLRRRLYRLAPRNDNWMLQPDVIALDHAPEVALNIIDAPRPVTAASANRAKAGPLLLLTGRVIDADDRPVSAAQIVIVNGKRLESLRCPKNGDACFPALKATVQARATGVSGSDGSFTLQVPAGLTIYDSVWVEGRDAAGGSIRTFWRVGSRLSLPTSSLGDIRLDRRVDFTLAVHGEGRPIAGAEVNYGYKVDGDNYSGTQRTDTKGALQFHQLLSQGDTPCCIPITIHAAGFASETWVGAIPMGTSTQVIELEPEAVQRGRVVDTGGRAVRNVNVQAHAVERHAPGATLLDPFPSEKSGTARTDNSGAFTLRGLHGGRQYRLVVISADGAVTKGERVVTAGGEPVDIVVPETRSGSHERKP